MIEVIPFGVTADSRKLTKQVNIIAQALEDIAISETENEKYVQDLMRHIIVKKMNLKHLKTLTWVFFKTTKRFTASFGILLKMEKQIQR